MSLDTTTIRSNLFAVAPKFNTSDAGELAIINGIIELKMLEIDANQWGSKANYVCSLLTAHHLELIGFKVATSTFTTSSSNTSISKKKAKNMEITYNTARINSSIDGNTSLTSTIYGTMYLDLKKTIRTGIPRLAGY